MQRDAKREIVTDFLVLNDTSSHTILLSSIHGRNNRTCSRIETEVEINWRVRADAFLEFAAHAGIQRTSLQSEIASSEPTIYVRGQILHGHTSSNDIPLQFLRTIKPSAARRPIFILFGWAVE